MDYKHFSDQIFHIIEKNEQVYGDGSNEVFGFDDMIQEVEEVINELTPHFYPKESP